MTTNGVQLSFEASGLDPRALSRLSIFERIELYDAIGLCVLQREAAEQAVLAVKRRTYPEASR